MTQKLAYPQCRQVLSTGRVCGCPALAGKSFCVHHSRERQRQRNIEKARQVKYDSQGRRPDSRPTEELDAAIFDSVSFPTLEDTASIAVAASSVAKLLGSGHLTPRSAHIMGNLIRIAEINLRKGNAFARTDMPPQLTDNSPVPAFGDEEGFVLPEEGPAYRAHQGMKRDFAERDAERAAELATASANASGGVGVGVGSNDSSGNGKPETGNGAAGVAQSFNSADQAAMESGALAPNGAERANLSRAGLGFMDHMLELHDDRYAHLPPQQRARAAYRDLRALILKKQQEQKDARRRKKEVAQAGEPVPHMEVKQVS